MSWPPTPDANSFPLSHNLGMDNRDRSARSLPAIARSWVPSPAFARIVPFALFMVFVAASSFAPSPEPVPPGHYDWRWIYAARAIVVGAVLIVLWRGLTELSTGGRLTVSHWLLATASGAVVFVVWIFLDHGWFVVGDGALVGFDPRQYGSEALHWPLTALRLLGLAVVVPVAEELFWRSFLLRWLEQQEFLSVVPTAIGVRALVITSVLFALEHSQWLAGLIAGLVYGWIYMRTSNLWVPIISHAVTNTALGGWILVTRQWHFW